jgi:tripartite-type tricarboxylate transporter receptor subunit TctC
MREMAAGRRSYHSDATVLNKAVNAGLADPKLKARLTDLGSVLLPGPPARFGQLIADETEKWGKVIRFAGIKAR